LPLPGIGHPSADLADRRRRQVRQQLHQVTLRINVVPAADAGDSATDPSPRLGRFSMRISASRIRRILGSGLAAKMGNANRSAWAIYCNGRPANPRPDRTSMAMNPQNHFLGGCLPRGEPPLAIKRALAAVEVAAFNLNRKEISPENRSESLLLRNSSRRRIPLSTASYFWERCYRKTRRAYPVNPGSEWTSWEFDLVPGPTQEPRRPS
jgi:hypothetical protein